MLGYLLAGLLVGPHSFGLIKESESILHFAELGVVLLLFIIGLEIQPRKLWAMRKHLFSLGFIQVAACSVLFWGVARLMGLDNIAAGVVGFSLSLSSTAFVIQTLDEKNQLRTEFGGSTFSILLMQDLVAIPALAIIPSLAATTSDSGMGVSTFLSFIAIIVGLVLLGRFLIHPMFRIIAQTHSKEIFTALTLFIVFGVASLMLYIGLSAALGTFIAGVLFADSEYRHELEANLEPFKSLLMGLFFIGVGMTVSLELILAKPLLVFALAAGYLILKMIAIYFVGRMAKMGHENSKLLGINLAQGGEFAFVIFGIAHTFKLVPDETLVLLTAIITVSMALNPLLILFNEYLSNKYAPIVEKKYDEVKDESPEVIIAGFGRFGQVIGRMLRSQGIPFISIDHDADQIELVRKFGNKVYYGDASRLDLLQAAGAAKAKFFVLAIDDVELSIKAAQVIKEHFPNLKVFARARNRGHVFDLMDLGVTQIKRETLDSSISFAGELLIEFGFDPEKIPTLIQKFKEHDEIMLQEQYKVRNDEKSFVSVSKQAQSQLAEILSSEAISSYYRPPTGKQ